MSHNASHKSNGRKPLTQGSRIGIAFGKLRATADGWFAVAVLGLVLVIWLSQHPHLM